MKDTNKLTVVLGFSLLLSMGAVAEFASGQAAPAVAARPPIAGQFAQDFVAGKVPRDEEVAAAEKDVAADPNNLALVRRLGKGYFFRFFGGGNVASVAKASATFDRALELDKNDAETLAYYGALWTFYAVRVEKADASKQKATFDKAFALLQRAETLAPRHGAVQSVTSASYLELPASFGMAPHVVGMLEGMRKGMGPQFNNFSHHGRQRLLLTLGRAYAMTGQPEKARANFDEALQINQESTEASLIKTELAKLPAKF